MEPTEYYQNKLGYQIAITEMQRQLDEQGQSVTAVKKIVENIFAASSLIIGLSTALGIFRAPVSSGHIYIYNTLMVMAVALYVFLICVSIWVLQPVKIYGPIKPEWNVLQDYYINFDDDTTVLKQHLSSYLNAIHLNEPIIVRRSLQAKYTSLFLPAIVVILFILGWMRG